MSDLLTGLVLDANVALATVLAQPSSAQATALLDSIADGLCVAFVPDLFFAEIASALSIQVKHPKTKLDRAEALDYLGDINALPWSITSCRQLASEAAVLACAHKISAYDAMYVALSERMGAPLVTGDKKLVNSLAGARYNVVWIEDAMSF